MRLEHPDGKVWEGEVVGPRLVTRGSGSWHAALAGRDVAADELLRDVEALT